MSPTPLRIQLSRQKGFRLQEHSLALNGYPAIKVDRTTRWGNPYRVVLDQMVPTGDLDEAHQHVLQGPWLCHSPAPEAFIGWWYPTKQEAIAKSVDLFRWRFLESDDPAWVELREQCLDALRWHNLACWCPLDAPCHGDVLLEHANRRIKP
jgi:hypothetical protein